jgi:uncharacterized GH25 family protein
MSQIPADFPWRILRYSRASQSNLLAVPFPVYLLPGGAVFVLLALFIILPTELQMNNNRGISPGVWAIAIGGFAIIVFVAWLGLRSHRQPIPQTQVQAQAAVPVNPRPIEKPQAAAPAPITNQGLPPVIPIPLANILVEAENSSWLKDKDYLQVPHDAQDFGGVRFLMDGLVQLQGQVSKEYRNKKYRTTISLPISVTNTIGSVHLLGGTRYGSDEKVFVQMVWHYSDGSVKRTPIDYLVHFRDWIRNSYEQPAHLPYVYSKVVWSLPQTNRALRLYRVTFPNPAPDKQICQLEFVSEMQEPTLFLVGVTLDPLKPGERPDGTADLEPTDPIPPQIVQILVTDPNNQPLATSHLQIQFQTRDGKNVSRAGSSMTTDASGVAQVGYPPDHLNTLDISASHENFGGRKILWNTESGDVIPATYTLKLTPEVTIGGTVVDEQSNAISGASISLNRFWSGEDMSPNRKGEQVDFKTQTLSTGPDGHWHAGGLPPQLLDNIMFNVKHPDFIPTNLNVTQNGDVEKQLRAETYKIILHQGLNVHGLVSDEDDNPISGATVWTGRKYFQDRQQTKTDGQGTFNFRNVSAGDVLFSVNAKGHSPDSKTLTVSTNMPDVVFKLKQGHVIRALVQDENGSPISGVRVSLEGGPNDATSYDAYDFSATTDSNGRFQWDGAPGETMPFYLGKEGYEQQRGVKLAPDQDNVVTLRGPRQLQGLVLDADSGQPVTKFNVRTGRRGGVDDSQVYGVINDHSYSAADGRFTVELDEANDNAVQVWSDDYLAQTESFPDAQNGTVQVTVRLKPSASLKGVVTMSDGTPVPGASVVAVSDENQPGFGVQLQGSRFHSWNQQTRVATTDADGKFSVSAPPETGNVLAIADAGFASASIEQVRASGVLTLQAFGRIEGTLTIAGSPGAGQDLLFNMNTPGVMSDFNGYKSTTDEQGHFTFEKIPPGDGSIVRLVKTSPNSWMHSHKTSVTVQAGQTTQVTLGDTGAVLRGTVRFQTPPTNGVHLTVSGNLSGPPPQAPAFSTPAEAQAYWRSPQGRAQQQQFQNWAVAANPDGTFQLDSIPPGNYTLNMSAQPDTQRGWSPPVAQGYISVSVPDNADPLNPIMVGEIVLRPLPPPNSLPNSQ